MLRIIAQAIALREPVRFVMYWGKGPRSRIADPDLECLSYLAAFGRRIRDVFEPGATINLIFTDTHAELNGHSAASMDEYFGGVRQAARQQNSKPVASARSRNPPRRSSASTPTRKCRKRCCRSSAPARRNGTAA